jgi:hypothetical protein
LQFRCLFPTSELFSINGKGFITTTPNHFHNSKENKVKNKKRDGNYTKIADNMGVEGGWGESLLKYTTVDILLYGLWDFSFFTCLFLFL